MPTRSVRFASAAAAALVALLAVNAGAPALMSGITSRLQAALAAAGVGPGVRVTMMPRAMEASIKTTSVSISGARKLANFTIVAPSGLPADVVQRRIFAAPLAVWIAAKHGWNIDGEQITFEYERSNGRRFSVIADRYSPESVPVPRYIYVVDDGSSATTLAQIRHENFAWRNGDQAIGIIADGAIDAREIIHMRETMGGSELPSYVGRPPHRDKVVKYTIPHP